MKSLITTKTSNHTRNINIFDLQSRHYLAILAVVKSRFGCQNKNPAGFLKVKPESGSVSKINLNTVRGNRGFGIFSVSFYTFSSTVQLRRIELFPVSGLGSFRDDGLPVPTFGIYIQESHID